MNKSTEDSRPIRNWPEYNQSLCNRGSITLWVDEEVVQEWYNKHLSGKPKGWKLPENEFTRDQQAIVARIIGHVSGIKNDVHDGTPPDEEMPSLEDIFSGRAGYAPAEVIFVPGDHRKYSNLGYMILSELFTDVTAKDFSRVMDEIILEPCGMTSSTFNQDLPASLKSRIAIGHDEHMDVVPYYKHASAGAGGLWTTPTDLGNFLIEVFNAYHDSSSSGKIISHKMAQRVFERSDEKLGFNKDITENNFVIRNDGSIPGYNCVLMGSVNKNQAVVMMLNTGSNQAYDFLNYLWRSISMEYDWELFEPRFHDAIVLPREDLMKFEGNYSDDKERFSIALHNNQLEVNSNQTGTRQLIPIDTDFFLIPEIPMRLGFEMDSSGAVINLYVNDEGGNWHPPYARE